MLGVNIGFQYIKWSPSAFCLRIKRQEGSQSFSIKWIHGQNFFYTFTKELWSYCKSDIFRIGKESSLFTKFYILYPEGQVSLIDTLITSGGLNVKCKGILYEEVNVG